MFNTCFLSQRSASFPSPEYDGTFSQLAQKVWVAQHGDLITLLGREFFYESPDPLLRRSYGAIYIKDMSAGEFFQEMERYRPLLIAREALV